jgi:hypothetical protein
MEVLPVETASWQAPQGTLGSIGGFAGDFTAGYALSFGTFFAQTPGFRLAHSERGFARNDELCTTLSMFVSGGCRFHRDARGLRRGNFVKREQ